MPYYKHKTTNQIIFLVADQDPVEYVLVMQPEIDAYNLSQTKGKAKSILENARKKTQYESITYNGKTFYATPTAQNNLFQSYTIAKELKETQLPWLDVNHQKVILTLEDALVLIKLLRNKTSTLYFDEAQKQIIVKDAVNVSQIEGVLSAGSYDVAFPTNTGNDSMFNTQLQPSGGLETGSESIVKK